MIILNLAGNTGVAAYGVVANTSLVAVALFNGIAQGSQPLISRSYGRGEEQNVRSLLKMALTTALGLGVLLMIFIFFSAPAVTAVFNSEHDLQLAAYADSGLRLYFIGFLFAGIITCPFAISSLNSSTEIFSLAATFFISSVIIPFLAASICVVYSTTNSS